MKRSTKVKAIVAIIVVAVVAVGLIGWARYRVTRGTRGGSTASVARTDASLLAAPEAAIRDELNAELERIRSAGEPMTMGEITPAPVPAEENAALLYEKAANTLPSQGQMDLFANFGAKPREGRPRPPTVDEVEPVLKWSGKTISLLTRAASLRGASYPHDWNTKHPESLTVASGAQLRKLTRLMAAQVRVDGQRGRGKEALQNVRVGFAIGESLRADPLMMSQVVRYSCDAMMLSSLQAMLSSCPAATDDCKALFDYLSSVDYGGDFRRALLSERAMWIPIFDRMKQDAVGAPTSGPPAKNGPSGFPIRPLKLVEADEVLYLRMQERQIRNASMPYRLNPDHGLDVATAFYPAGRKPSYAMMTDALAPSGYGGAKARDRAEASRALAMAALALRAYNNEKGSYPASLEDLRKVVPWKLAEDPFSGADLKYLREGKGYLLYSIGQDLKDDNGLDYLRPLPQGAKRDNTGDIIWKATR